jgi:RNA-directed DNA polymerase
MRKRYPSDNSTRKVRSSPERSSAPAGHAAVGDVPSSRHQATVPSKKPGEETRPERDCGGWDPLVPLIRLPGHAEAVSPRKGKLKAHSLIDKVYSGKNLYRAWRKVRANKGVHGLDRVTIRMFEKDVDIHLREIQRKLREQRFEPQPVLRVYIPKPADPKKRRPLGIPVVADRIVQQAIVQVVEPLFDAQMSSRSFGYRKGRKAHDAIATIIQDAKEGFRVVLDADIASFFDTLDHEVVMSRVRARIADGRVLDLIEAFLKAGISENNVVTVPTEGTPQGGVISPWLSNLVLDDLDKALESRGWRHVRYADDFVVLCRSREEAQDALAYVQEVLGKLKLSLSETKTKVSDCTEGFEFLGFRFWNYRLGVRAKSIERFKDRVRTLTQRQQGRNVEAVLEDLNPVIRGWANYVGVAQVADLFCNLDCWIRMRLRSFKTKHRNTNDNWRIPSRRLKKWGLLSLQECRPKLRLSYVSRTIPSESEVGSL